MAIAAARWRFPISDSGTRGGVVGRPKWRSGEAMAVLGMVDLRDGETGAAAKTAALGVPGIFWGPAGCRGTATTGTLSAAAACHSAALHCRALGSAPRAPAAIALPCHPAGSHLPTPATVAFSSPSLRLIDRQSLSILSPLSYS